MAIRAGRGEPARRDGWAGAGDRQGRCTLCLIAADRTATLGWGGVQRDPATDRKGTGEQPW
jgi:hypothetical protein